MAKTKGALFSLGATGTVGDTITYQGSRGSARAISKPGGSAVRSAGQLIHAAWYAAASAIWHGLTAAQKDCFALALNQPSTNGGYSLYMSNYLANIRPVLLAALQAQYAAMSAPELAGWAIMAEQYTVQYATPFSALQAFELTAIPDLYTYHGLCGFWPMDEPAGGFMIDYSGNGNHKSLLPTYPTNCPTRVISPSNGDQRVLSFDGINNYCYSPGIGLYNAMTALSIKANIFVTSFVTDKCYISKHQCFSIQTEGTEGGILVTLNNATTGQWMRFVAKPEYPTVNTWNRITATWNGLDIRLFRNGVQTARPPRQLTAPSQNNAAGLNIGRNGGGYHYWKDLLCMMMTYNRALSTSET